METYKRVHSLRDYIMYASEREGWRPKPWDHHYNRFRLHPAKPWVIQHKRGIKKILFWEVDDWLDVAEVHDRKIILLDDSFYTFFAPLAKAYEEYIFDERHVARKTKVILDHYKDYSIHTE